MLTLNFLGVEGSQHFIWINLLVTVSSLFVSVLTFSSNLSTSYGEISHSPSVSRRTWLVFN